jgi:Holliday junction DNA helicase RuvA
MGGAHPSNAAQSNPSGEQPARFALRRERVSGTITEQNARTRGFRERQGRALITHIRGILRKVDEEELTLALEPIELGILIPEQTRRVLQSKLGEPVSLFTVLYIEGGQMGARMIPRLVGFLSTLDREFFEIFCSVDGVGVRKALRAMTRPVRELARTIQDQDVRTLATYPGIGEAMAERIVAKLRRKVGKFALIVGAAEERVAPGSAGSENGQAENAEPDVIRDTFETLLSVGHNESQARQLLDRVLAGKKKFKSVADMIDAIYQQSR